MFATGPLVSAPAFWRKKKSSELLDTCAILAPMNRVDRLMAMVLLGKQPEEFDGQNGPES